MSKRNRNKPAGWQDDRGLLSDALAAALHGTPEDIADYAERLGGKPTQPETLDPAAILAVALDRACHGQDPDGQMDDAALEDVQAILSLMGQSDVQTSEPTAKSTEEPAKLERPPRPGALVREVVRDARGLISEIREFTQPTE